MVRPVFIRRVGAAMALLGIGCLLLAIVVPFAHLEPNRALPGMERVLPEHYSVSVLDLLRFTDVPGAQPAAATRKLFLLPFLGSCLVVIEALRAWQGSAAHRLSLALLLLGMSCALFGLAATPALVQLAFGIFTDGSVMMQWAGAGAGLASLGFGAAAAGGVLLAVGALLHRWTLRRNDSRASATTTG